MVEIEAHSSGVDIQSYRAGNGIFAVAEFKTDISNINQRTQFCGVGAYHQNGIAEKNIRTFVEKVIIVLLHAHVK